MARTVNGQRQEDGKPEERNINLQGGAYNKEERNINLQGGTYNEVVRGTQVNFVSENLRNSRKDLSKDGDPAIDV